MTSRIAIPLVLLVAACSSSSSNTSAVGADASTGQDAGGADATPAGPIKTVFTIVLENHDYDEIVGSTNAPYFNSLLTQGTLATAYKDTGHPSLPNYLHMISGDNQYTGPLDQDPQQAPNFPSSAQSLGTQMEAAGVKWRSYQESMGTPCLLTSAGEYAPRHDPFLYFKDLQASPLCADRNVDYTQFGADLAANSYRYMWITPNLLNDGHDPKDDAVTSLKTSDTWLSNEVPKILASDGYKNGGVLFITWDEAEGRNGDDTDKIPMLVLSPKLKAPGATSATAYTHSSYLAAVEDLLGLSRLPTVTSAPSLVDLLNP